MSNRVLTDCHTVCMKIGIGRAGLTWNIVGESGACNVSGPCSIKESMA